MCSTRYHSPETNAGKTYSTFPRGIESNRRDSAPYIIKASVRPIRHSHGELKATISLPCEDEYNIVRPIRHSHGELKAGSGGKLMISTAVSGKTYSTFPRGIERFRSPSTLDKEHRLVRPIRHSHGELKAGFYALHYFLL